MSGGFDWWLAALVRGMSMRIGWIEGVDVECCEKGVLQTPAQLTWLTCC